MNVHNLGPHTFISPPHPNHHEWLSSFSPEQRRQLIEEDYEARTGAFTVLISGMLFGLGLLVIAVITMLSRG